MHIAIIGAGVVGTATAWEFLRQGHRVTLLEAREGPGLVTSYANGGQLSYDYVAPLADPGVLYDLPKWLLDPGSPLRFRPRLSPRQWRWLAAFLRACNAGSVQASTRALLQLSYLSRDTLHSWLRETPIEFHHKANGKLIAFRSPALLAKARRQVEYQASHGSRQTVLDRSETLAVEPALASMGDALAGSVYTPTEEVGDSYLFTRGLFEMVQAHPAATVRTGARVSRLLGVAPSVTGAQLDTGEVIEADHFVVANGLQGYELLRQHGMTVPLYGLKGYSLSVTLPPEAEAAPDRPPIAPSISVTDYERRIVYARLGQVLRLAAMVDMGDLGADPRPDRIRRLKSQARETFPQLDVESAEAWAGERPATPDGKPIIGRSRKYENLWLNLGHGALGFTLACGSAALLQSLVNRQPAPVEAAPFALR